MGGRGEGGYVEGRGEQQESFGRGGRKRVGRMRRKIVEKRDRI